MSRTPLHPTPFLRLALLADAAGSGAAGLLLIAVPLGGAFGLPDGLLRAAAALMLAWAAFTFWLGNHPAPTRALVRAVVAVNVIWVVDSLMLLLGPAMLGLSPTALGTGFVLAQAALVAGFAAAQWAALRRAEAAPAFA